METFVNVLAVGNAWFLSVLHYPQEERVGESGGAKSYYYQLSLESYVFSYML